MPSKKKQTIAQKRRDQFASLIKLKNKNNNKIREKKRRQQRKAQQKQSKHQQNKQQKALQNIDETTSFINSVLQNVNINTPTPKTNKKRKKNRKRKTSEKEEEESDNEMKESKSENEENEPPKKMRKVSWRMSLCSDDETITENTNTTNANTNVNSEESPDTLSPCTISPHTLPTPTTTNIRQVTTPIVATDDQKLLVIQQAAQSQISKLKKKKKTLKQTAANARKNKKKTPKTKKKTTKTSWSSKSATKQKQATKRQFDRLQMSLDVLINRKQYKPSAETFNSIVALPLFQVDIKNLRYSDTKLCASALKRLNLLAIVSELVKFTKKKTSVSSSKLLIAIITRCPFSMYDKPADLSSKSVSSALQIIIEASSFKVKWGNVKEGDTLHYFEPSSQCLDIVKDLYNLESVDDAKQFITSLQRMNCAKGNKLIATITSEYNWDSFIQLFVPFSEIYSSNLGSFLAHKIGVDGILIENEPAVPEKENKSTLERRKSTGDVLGYADDNENEFDKVVSNNKKNDSESTNNDDNVYRVSSEKGKLLATKYTDGSFILWSVTGSNIKAVEVGVDSRGFVSAKFSLVNISKLPDGVDYDLYQTQAPIKHYFDSLSLKGDRGLTNDHITIPFVSDTKVTIRYPILNNTKKHKNYILKTSVSNLAIKLPQKMILKRKQSTAQQTNPLDIEYFASEHLKNEDILQSFKATYSSFSSLQNMTQDFERYLLPICSMQNVYKKFVNENGALDVNITYSYNRPKLQWTPKEFDKLHKAYILVQFSSMRDLCIVLTKPKRNGDVVILSVSDYSPYQINLQDSSEDLYLP